MLRELAVVRGWGDREDDVLARAGREVGGEWRALEKTLASEAAERTQRRLTELTRGVSVPDMERSERLEVSQVVGVLSVRPPPHLRLAWHLLQILWQAPVRDGEREDLRAGSLRVAGDVVHVSYLPRKTIHDSLQLDGARAAEVAVRRMKVMFAVDVEGTPVQPTASARWLYEHRTTDERGREMGWAVDVRSEDLRRLVQEAATKLRLPKEERRRWFECRATWRGLRSVLHSAALGGAAEAGEQLGHVGDERMARALRAAEELKVRQLGNLGAVQEAYTVDTPGVRTARVTRWRELVTHEVRLAMEMLWRWGGWVGETAEVSVSPGGQQRTGAAAGGGPRSGGEDEVSARGAPRPTPVPEDDGEPGGWEGAGQEAEDDLGGEADEVVGEKAGTKRARAVVRSAWDPGANSSGSTDAAESQGATRSASSGHTHLAGEGARRRLQRTDDAWSGRAGVQPRPGVTEDETHEGPSAARWPKRRRRLVDQGVFVTEDTSVSE
jgi:hypothetical protein